MARVRKLTEKEIAYCAAQEAAGRPIPDTLAKRWYAYRTRFVGQQAQPERAPEAPLNPDEWVAIRPSGDPAVNRRVFPEVAHLMTQVVTKFPGAGVELIMVRSDRATAVQRELDDGGRSRSLPA